MTRPLQKGDVCKVIRGFTQQASPNVGLTVTVDHRVFGTFGGDHSKFGAMYRIVGAGLSQLAENGQFAVTGWADIPGAWLERIDPPPEPAQAIDASATCDVE